MRYVLVQFSDRWQDEFRVFGFAIMSQLEYERWRDKLVKKEWPGRATHFGTNQWFVYESLEDYEECITTTDLNHYTGELFIHTFEGSVWGNFVNPVDYD